MMEENNNKVVTVTTTKKKLVGAPVVEKFEDKASHSMEEHMENNAKNVKFKVDFQSVAGLVIMLIIIAGSVFLFCKYLDSYEEKKEKINKATITTTTTTTTTTTQEIRYETTTRVQTQATHTIFVPR